MKYRLFTLAWTTASTVLQQTQKSCFNETLILNKRWMSTKNVINVRASPIAHKMVKTVLVAFDFDHTIVDDNSDTVAQSLLREHDYAGAKKVYKETESWTLYMREVFHLLHKNGVKKEAILNSIKKIPPIKGMDNLMNYLNNDKCEVIIISDSNSIFIDEWLKAKNLNGTVKKIFTNPAFFDDSELLNILPYHEQDFCKLSEWNLCKGFVLESYIEERKNENVTFKHVAFIGDGSNDFCPSLKLSKGDLVFPRINYSLHKKISGAQDKIKADVFPWTTGDDVLDILKPYVNT